MKITKGLSALLLVLCVAGIAADRAAAKDATAKLTSQWGATVKLAAGPGA